MRNRILASLALSISIASGSGHAATVDWRPGVTIPPTEIAPLAPTQLDAVSFTAATPPYLSPFGNSCEAEAALGSPVISTDAVSREFHVEFTPKPPPPVFCPFIYDPVNGIEGELGQLDPGDWSLIITNINDPSMDVTLPFRVRSVSAASSELILHTVADDAKTGTPFPFDAPFFVARPLGVHCNPENGGTICDAATLQRGAPLEGAVALDFRASAPRFKLPRRALSARATGSLPLYRPYAYISTHASSAYNESGAFGPGYGPGERTLHFSGVGESAARVAIHPGEHQFGGTMRLLGAIGSERAHEYRNRRYAASGFSSFGVVGGPLPGRCDHSCIWNGSADFNFQARQYRTSMGKYTTAYIYTLGLPWTTGAVTITATDGPFPTHFRRSGYDNRTTKGSGTIQMVAPQLTRWEFREREAPWDRHTGAIAILRIQFAPEPSSGAMLVVGLGGLAALYRVRTRSGQKNEAPIG